MLHDIIIEKREKGGQRMEIFSFNIKEKYGVATASLASVMSQVFGHYMTHHNAEEDTLAAYLLLVDNFREILEYALIENFKIIAHNSPFMMKDAIKERGYKWDGPTKTWYLPVCYTPEVESAWLNDLSGEIAPEKVLNNLYTRYAA